MQLQGIIWTSVCVMVESALERLSGGFPCALQRSFLVCIDQNARRGRIQESGVYLEFGSWAVARVWRPSS